MKAPAEQPIKKAYQEPKLAMYGSLTEMTKANTMVGGKDGGPNNSKTAL